MDKQENKIEKKNFPFCAIKFFSLSRHIVIKLPLENCGLTLSLFIFD